MEKPRPGGCIVLLPEKDDAGGRLGSREVSQGGLWGLSMS